ncbi:MAG: hypothetical protein JXD19_01220 [Deltaproteobacteria bacterium]|nr:hypothetical protein [Deltaproteobacteria bacterium]
MESHRKAEVAGPSFTGMTEVTVRTIRRDNLSVVKWLSWESADGDGDSDERACFFEVKHSIPVMREAEVSGGVEG